MQSPDRFCPIHSFARVIGWPRGRSLSDAASTPYLRARICGVAPSRRGSQRRAGRERLRVDGAPIGTRLNLTLSRAEPRSGAKRREDGSPERIAARRGQIAASVPFVLGRLPGNAVVPPEQP